MTLREQIEALPLDWDDSGNRTVRQKAVLDIIDQHRCIPDRDALARALDEHPDPADNWNYEVRHCDGLCADAIIAALEEQG